MKRNFVLVLGLAILGAAWFARSGSVSAPSTPSIALVEHRPSDTHAPSLAVPVTSSRGADEWQGMAIDDAAPACDTSERCGLATACIEGRCGGCTVDRDCASGEACVLDHCVRSELVACRSHTECKDGELCVLSGVSSDARGNGDMRAYCQGQAVDIAQSREAYEANQQARVGIPAPQREVTPQGLLETL